MLATSPPATSSSFSPSSGRSRMARNSEALGIIRKGLRREPLTSDGIFKLPLPPDQAASALTAPVPAKPSDASSSGPVMVRTYLRSMADEQVVVMALLESAALSVQLHDIDSPEDG